MSKENRSIVDAYREKVTDVSSASGIPLKDVYTSEDLSRINPEKDIGLPGQYPFTRGHHREMYRGKLWNIRQITGLSTPQRLNERLNFELSEGANALDYHIDGLGSYGLEPDQDAAVGQLGITGVASNTLKDVGTAVEALPLDQVSICFVSPFPTLVQAYILEAKRRGYDPSQLRIVHCAFTLWYPMCHYSYQESLFTNGGLSKIGKWGYDFCEYALKNLPKLNIWHFDGPSATEGGGNAIHEMAFVLAVRNELIREMLKRGVDINTIGRRLSPTVSLGSDFFENIIKLRAARQLWARTMKEDFGATDPAAMTLRIHANVVGSIYTRQQPLVNIARGAIAALSGVLAGSLGLQVAAYDESFCTPTEESVQLAIRTQQVLRYETGVAKVADPLGGSYYVEALTKKMEEEIDALLDKIEEMGGWMKVLQSGWVHEEMQKGALEDQKKVESGEKIVVGLNEFTIPPEEDMKPKLFAPDPADVEAYIADFKAFKKSRNNTRVKETLTDLRKTAEQGNTNLVPSVFRALEAESTFPEILGVLRMADGLEYDWAGERKYPF
jgi:methylmalonyl-CoA mutase N-terminal domain/subunit